MNELRELKTLPKVFSPYVRKSKCETRENKNWRNYQKIGNSRKKVSTKVKHFTVIIGLCSVLLLAEFILCVTRWKLETLGLRYLLRIMSSFTAWRVQDRNYARSYSPERQNRYISFKYSTVSGHWVSKFMLVWFVGSALSGFNLFGLSGIRSFVLLMNEGLGPWNIEYFIRMPFSLKQRTV